MENPTKQENIISKESALDLLSSLIEEFDSESINKYLNQSKIEFNSEKMYNDTEQRKVLIPVVNNVDSMLATLFKTLEQTDHDAETKYTSALRSLYGVLYTVKELLAQAPDIRYSEDNLIKLYGGRENVPLGESTYENTQREVRRLVAMIEGIKIGLNFTK